MVSKCGTSRLDLDWMSFKLIFSIAVKEGIELNSESRPRIKDIQDLYLPMKSRPDEKVIEILNETTGNDLTTEVSELINSITSQLLFNLV